MGRKGNLPHIFQDRNIKMKGQNVDARRVAMYAFYASRGDAIPFELADKEEELAKFADFDYATLVDPPEEFDDAVLDLLDETPDTLEK
jgi:hypothetical protein